MKSLKTDFDLDKNVFLFYNPVQEDALALQSEKELRELFQNFNDLMEINISSENK